MKIFCILSDERAFKSKSPAMHNAVLKATGINGVYVPFAVEPHRIGDAVRGIRALNIMGANVTVPHKELVIPHLDALNEGAEGVGAVNTIINIGDTLVGANTDTHGFQNALDDADFEAASKSILVVGTGGASKAVLFALGQLGAARILLAGRDLDKTKQLAKDRGAEAIPLESLLGTTVAANAVVNATTVSSPTEGPELADLLSQLQLQDCELVVDLNYGRTENIWQSLAEASSAGFIDGLPMLAHQARRSFELWTGLDVEVEQFMKALQES
jgi:shikimate dehydrogenase